MLIDTHAHINFIDYKDDGDEVVERALGENIWLINVGSERDTSQRAVAYAQKYPSGVWAAVGLHPGSLVAQEYEEKVDGQETIKFETRAQKFDYEFYKSLAQNPKVVAIGEVGLDYYRLSADRRGTGTRTGADIKNLQKEVFIQQLELADELSKPVIVHCRDAHQDLLEILKQYLLPERSAGGAESKADTVNPSTSSGYKLRGVIHSFSGRWSQAQQYLDMGFYLGFNGIITFARDYDRVVREMPLQRLLLETDCPYLTPIPFRGKRNEPSYVKYVAEKVAELRGISVEEVAEQTTKNARELFQV